MIDWTLIPYAALLVVTTLVVARLHGAALGVYWRGSMLLLALVAAMSGVAVAALSSSVSAPPAEVALAAIPLLLAPVATALAAGRLAGRFGRGPSIGAAAAAYLAALVAAVIGVIDHGLVR